MATKAAYSVGTSNRFEAFLFEDSPARPKTSTKPAEKKPAGEQKKKPEQKTDSKAPTQKPPVNKSQDVKPKESAEKPKASQGNKEGGRGGRGGFSESRGGRGGRGGRGAASASYEKPSNEERGEGGRGGRGRGRGGRDFRGDRPPRPVDTPTAETSEPTAELPRDPLAAKPVFEDKKPNRRERREKERLEEGHVEEQGVVYSKRVFDRKSGTGRPPTENKRRGAGRGNWGTLTSEHEDAVHDAASTEATTSQPVTKTEPEESEEARKFREEREKEEEEENKKMTLEEYKKLQEENRAAVSLPHSVRKAGEGEEQSKWAEYAPLKKDDIDEKSFSKKKDSKANQAKAKAHKVPVDQILDLKVNNPEYSPSRANRSRRGRPQQAKAENSGSSAPIVVSEAEFPSLAR